MSNPLTIEELAGALTKGQRLFGLDLGSKTIGIAICNGEWTIATPYETLRRTKFTADVAELAKMAAREKVFGLVLGLPVNMDGSEGPRAQSTRAFVRNMPGKLDLPLALWDERLSTVAAQDLMVEAGMRRAKRALHIDAVAASIILQGALDQLVKLR